MKKYAKVVNDETKECQVGLGTNSAFYQSIGMSEMEIEQSYDGSWYQKGFAPVKPADIVAQEKRQERDELLLATDKIMIADYPISADQRLNYQQYRQYLRDIPAQETFPEVIVMTFEDWLVNTTSDVSA